MEVREDISVKEYFEEVVPKMFEEEISKVSIGGMEGTEFTVEFDVDGQAYSLIVKDAKELQVKEGKLDSPMVRVVLTEDVWRKAITGKMPGAVDMFTEMGQLANRKRYDTLKDTKGTMNLELSLPDGTTAQIKVVFNNADSPAVTFKTALEDWVKIASGELPGPMAFMQGKLKLEGDMTFAMSLGNLLS
ncbi:MAG: SCP2 sterol-binding domain-containing protein [Candidatus Geothermincolales bacterium]